MDLHPSVQLNLTDRISLIADGDFFWRQSTHDGIYGIPGNLIRSGQSSKACYIGSHSSLQLEWRLASLALAGTMAVATSQRIGRGELFISPHGHSWEASSFYLTLNVALV